MNKHLLLPLIILIATAVGATGYAKKSTDDRAAALTDQLARNLDLTDVQRRKLELIRNDVLDKRSELIGRRTMEEAKLQVISQLHGERFDAAKYDEYKKRSLQRYDRFYAHLGRKLGEFHALLSPPQREKLILEIQKNPEVWGIEGAEEDPSEPPVPEYLFGAWRSFLK